jgi:hypothetical protein
MLKEILLKLIITVIPACLGKVWRWITKKISGEDKKKIEPPPVQITYTFNINITTTNNTYNTAQPIPVTKGPMQGTVDGTSTATGKLSRCIHLDAGQFRIEMQPICIKKNPF